MKWSRQNAQPLKALYKDTAFSSSQPDCPAAMQQSTYAWHGPVRIWPVPGCHVILRLILLPNFHKSFQEPLVMQIELRATEMLSHQPQSAQEPPSPLPPQWSCCLGVSKCIMCMRLCARMHAPFACKCCFYKHTVVAFVQHWAPCSFLTSILDFQCDVMSRRFMYAGTSHVFPTGRCLHNQLAMLQCVS